MPEPESQTPSFAQLYVELIQIRNFRGISELEIELEPRLTLLVGRNNSGKSRVLRALGLALGGLVAELDDLTVGQETPAEIDVVVAPPPPDSEESEDSFVAPVAQRLKSVQTVREEPLRERFAWRTRVQRSSEGLGARTDMHLLLFDDTRQTWVSPQNPDDFVRSQRSLFAADLVETRRDLVDELTRRGSAIRRVLSDLEVDAKTRGDLEDRLAALGSEIVAGSQTLEAVKRSLEDLEKVVGSIGTPAMNPLPLRLEELARSVAIDLDTGSGGLPVRLHGAGARSLASLQVQGVLYDRRLGRDGPELRPHPVTLVEEPEAHLHPQASLELSGLLTAMNGQVVASTHSSHLVTTVEPRAIRLIRQEGAKSTVVDLGPARTDDEARHRAQRPSLHAAEMEKLKRLVERPFGELLFGSAIVIGDGATERGFLPIVLRHALADKAHGVCVIDPGSMGGDVAQAAVKFANLIDVPWLLFSDSDGPGKKDAEALVEAHGAGDQSRIVWVVAGDSGEAGGATEAMLVAFDEELCRDACLEVRPGLPASHSTLQMLNGVKGFVGPTLARRLVEKYPEHGKWPDPLREIVSKLDGVL